MGEEGEISNLEQLLDEFDEAAEDKKRVSLDQILDVVGRRSFGPLLLVAGLIVSAPIIGDVPGVPTVIGIFVVIISAQLIFHHDHFWLPHWMLKRSVSTRKLHKVNGKWLRPAARWVDRFLKPRLRVFTGKGGAYAIAITCSLLSFSMPFTEVVPFSANGVGAGIVAFGVALIAHDGLMALIG